MLALPLSVYLNRQEARPGAIAPIAPIALIAPIAPTTVLAVRRGSGGERLEGGGVGELGPGRGSRTEVVGDLAVWPWPLGGPF